MHKSLGLMAPRHLKARIVGHRLVASDGSPILTGFVVAYAFALQVHGETGTLRGGRANDAIANVLLGPALRGMPKVLEYPVALSYCTLLKERPHLARESGPILIVDEYRELPGPKEKPRISASEVTEQSTALLGTLAQPLLPVIPIGVEAMRARILQDTRIGLGRLPLHAQHQAPIVEVVNGFPQDLHSEVPRRHVDEDGEWINKHWWTANLLWYKGYDVLAYLRDWAHLHASAQDFTWHPHKRQWGPAFESSLFALKTPRQLHLEPPACQASGPAMPVGPSLGL